MQEVDVDDKQEDSENGSEDLEHHLSTVESDLDNTDGYRRDEILPENEEELSESDGVTVSEEESDESSATYNSILKKLVEEWLICEIDHRLSKEASNAFFELAKDWFFKLFEAKNEGSVTKKIPMFVHLRKTLFKKKLPPVSLGVAFKDKESGQSIVLKNLESIPVGKFPPNKFEKLYETASVKVRT